MSFKIADGYVEVHLQDHTARDLAQIVARLRAASQGRTDFRIRVDSSQAEGAMAQLQQSTTRLQRSTDAAVRGFTLKRSTLISLAAGAAGVAAAVAAAGVAFTAFAAVAAPSIAKVITAQEDLATSWGTLSQRQRVSAVAVRALVDEYKALAGSYEPEALTAFNGLVDTSRALLPRLGAVVDATSGDVQRFISRLADFTTGRFGDEFLTWTAREAPQALDLLGTTLTTAGDTALDLVQDLAPLGISLLQLTNRTLSLVNGIAGINPELAQFAVTALMLRGPVSGVVGGVGNMAGRLRTAGTAAQGASKSTRLLNLVTAAGPNLYVAAGVAIGFLALKALSAKTSTDRLVESLQVQHRAFGNNIAGYQALITELQPRLTSALANFQAHQKRMTDVQKEGTRAAADAARKYSDVARAYNEQTKLLQNVVTGSQQLAGKYHITAEQANRLATVAGVDLSTSIDKSGQLTAEAAAKIDRYRQAAELAANPTRQVSLALADAGNSALQMKDRIAALTTALDAYFNPSIAVYKATTQLKSGYQSLITQLAEAKGRMDGNTTASVQLRTAFATQLETVRDLYTATFNQSRSVDQASVVVRTHLPVLYALAGRSREARAQVDALARSTDNSTGRQNISRKAFMQVASSMGITRGRAAELWSAYSKLPAARQTKISTPGMGDAIRASKNLGSAIRNLPSQKTINVIVNNIERGTRVTGFGRTHHADGGIVSYAAGGTFGMRSENHVAQIASAGVMRVWAEPETGGEAYIPLAPAKRDRSEAILAQVAELFGLAVMRPMAEGGILAFAQGGRTSAKGTTAQRRSAGSSLISGITLPMMQSLEKVQEFASKVNDTIKKYFAGSWETKILRWATGIESSMKAAATKAESIAARIEEAKEYAATTKGNLVGFTQLSSLGPIGSASDIQSGLSFRLEEMQTFSSKLGELAKLGVNKTLMQEIINAGPEQGAVIADMLLKDTAAIPGFNQTQAQIDAISTTIGNQAADIMFDEGKNAAAGFLSGLTGQQKELEALMAKLGGQLASGVAQYFGVKGSAAKPPVSKPVPGGTWSKRTSGGITHRGLALVGEQGPELVRIGSTSRVFTARETAGMLGGVHIGTVNIQVTGTLDFSNPKAAERLAEQAADAIREKIRRIERSHR